MPPIADLAELLRKMMTGTRPTFVSESIKPVTATSDAAAMAGGGPGLPNEFLWREQHLRISTVLRVWKEAGPCKHGSSELYVRKHWFEVLLASGQTAQIYFERQPGGRRSTKRWWLYTIREDKDNRPDSRLQHTPLQASAEPER